MPDLLDMIDDIEIQKEKPFPKLKPPKPPKPKEKEYFGEISFEEIANSSEFKRLIYLIWFGKTHRGKSKDLEIQLSKRKQEITIIKKFEMDTRKDFTEVIKELKTELAKRKIEA